MGRSLRQGLVLAALTASCLNRVELGGLDPSDLVAVPDTIPADGVTPSRVALVLHDAHGARGVAYQARFHSGATLGAPVCDSAGRCTVDLTSASPGTYPVAVDVRPPG